MIYSLVKSLVLTLIIELTTSVIIGIRKKEDIKVVVLANIITNPVIVYLAIGINSLNNVWLYNVLVILMEIIVFFVEARIYKKHLIFKEKSPLYISTVNNVTSFMFGVIKTMIIQLFI